MSVILGYGTALWIRHERWQARHDSPDHDLVASFPSPDGKYVAKWHHLAFADVNQDYVTVNSLGGSEITLCSHVLCFNTLVKWNGERSLTVYFYTYERASADDVRLTKWRDISITASEHIYKESSRKPEPEPRFRTSRERSESDSSH